MAEAISLIKQSLVISEPLITSGGDVFIACDTLEFSGNGVINTGFSQAATGNGNKAGSITILARHIRSLKLVTHGQAGGVGASGDRGYRGYVGSQGSSGKNAECGGMFGIKAGDGGKGGTGGRGRDGGSGRPGGRGGDGGSVTIRYWKSDQALNLPGNFVDLRGGKGGLGGPGGPPGFGGEGGEGGFGGEGASCEGTTRSGNDRYYSVKEGARGPKGDAGPNGENSGPQGPEGETGYTGRYSAQQYANEDEFRAEIKRYIPVLGNSSFELGERLYMLNRFDEARAMFATAIKNKIDRRLDAERMLERMDGSRNYFNRRILWAPLELREQGNVQVLRPVEDISVELERVRILLSEASRVAEYRSRQVYDRETAINAFEFEKRQLDNVMISVRSRLANVEGDLLAVRSRINALQAQGHELGGRIVKLVEQLRDVPDLVIQKGRDMISSLGLFGTSLDGAIIAGGTGNWLGAVSGLLSAMGALQDGINAAQSILDIGVNIQAQIDRTRDELYRTRDLIDQAHNDIRQILSRQAEDTQRAALLDQTRSLLGSYQQNQDVDSLRVLDAQSAAVLWQVRKMVAEQLYIHRRYLDLRLGRADAIQPMTPPGGVDDAFSYLHLLSLLSDIQSANIFDGLPDITSWGITFSAQELPTSFDRLCLREARNLIVTGVPEFLSPSRVRSVTVRVFDSSEQPVRGYFRLSQGRGEAYALSGNSKYELDGTSWLFRTDSSGSSPQSDARFAFRNPASVWTLEAKDLPKASVGAAVKPIYQVVLDFELETVATKVQDRYVESDIPEENGIGTPAWQKTQMQAITLARLSESREDT